MDAIGVASLNLLSKLVSVLAIQHNLLYSRDSEGVSMAMASLSCYFNPKT